MSARLRATLCVLALASPVAACTPGTPGPPAAALTDVSRAPQGEMAHLKAVRLNADPAVDRLEFDFTDRVPGYTVGYHPLPARADASGFEIPLPGATALLQIALNPATATGWSGGPLTYPGPDAVRAPGTGEVTEAKAAGDFEAVLTWVVGLRSEVPFRVRTLADPPRLVVEFTRR